MSNEQRAEVERAVATFRDSTAPLADRHTAAEWLCERLFGRAP